jgi:hypothetical protein
MANTIGKSRDHIQYPGIGNKSRSVVADGVNQVAEHGKAYVTEQDPCPRPAYEVCQGRGVRGLASDRES